MEKSDLVCGLLVGLDGTEVDTNHLNNMISTRAEVLSHSSRTCAAGCSSAAIEVSRMMDLNSLTTLTELDGPDTGSRANIKNSLGSLGTRGEVCLPVERGNEVGMLHVWVYGVRDLFEKRCKVEPLTQSVILLLRRIMLEVFGGDRSRSTVLAYLIVG